MPAAWPWGQLLARRLRERPQRLDLARAILDRWRPICAPNVQAALAEWQTILEAGLDAMVAVLTGTDERSERLREVGALRGPGDRQSPGAPGALTAICAVNRVRLEHVIRASDEQILRL